MGLAQELKILSVREREALKEDGKEKFLCKCSPRTCQAIEKAEMLGILEERSRKIEEEIRSIPKQQDELEELDGRDCPLDVFLRKEARLEDLRNLAWENSGRNEEMTPDMGVDQLISLLVNNTEGEDVGIRVCLKTTELERLDREKEQVEDLMQEVEWGKIKFRTCFDPDDLSLAGERIENLDSDSISTSTEFDAERVIGDSCIDLNTCDVAISENPDLSSTSVDKSNNSSPEKIYGPAQIGEPNKEPEMVGSSCKDCSRNLNSPSAAISERPDLSSTSVDKSNNSTEQHCQTSGVLLQHESCTPAEIPVFLDVQSRNEPNAVSSLNLCPPSDGCCMEADDIDCVGDIRRAKSSVRNCYLGGENNGNSVGPSYRINNVRRKELKCVRLICAPRLRKTTKALKTRAFLIPSRGTGKRKKEALSKGGFSSAAKISPKGNWPSARYCVKFRPPASIPELKENFQALHRDWKRRRKRRLLFPLCLY